MKNKKEFEEFIKKFDDRDYQGSYAEEAAEIYGDRIMKSECDDRAASCAKDGFILGFIWARKLEGY